LISAGLILPREKIETTQ